MKLTEKQHELWKVANAEILKIGGISRITRHPDSAIRNAAKKEGTKQWAIIESTRLASPLNDGEMNDDYCQKLINIISQ